MYRKIGLVILSVVILLGWGAYSLQGSTPVKIIFNGRDLVSDVPAQIIDGRTMVPLRVIAESLEAEVNWDEEKRIVYIKKETSQTSDWNLLKLNGEPTTWPYWIRDGKMYLEYRNAIQLVREGNRAPLHSVSYFPHNNTLYVDDLRYPLSLNEEGQYKVVSIDYFRDLGIVNYHWDAANENLELIYR
ncbi:MAG TPA: copper amine oxidase N-terminal domain-containing protein [Corynebacteriales bacterium]|nr:copper amine oxidase N-terminal domain-containing protein [Mycobacteriales bacterium]